MLLPALQLLHQLVYPIPSTSRTTITGSQRKPDTNLGTQNAGSPGIDLAQRLHAASMVKEFSGIQHAFVSALGRLAYADADIEGALAMEGEQTDIDIRHIQGECAGINPSNLD